jgi:hypothetical protein
MHNLDSNTSGAIMGNFPSTKRLLTFFGIGAGLAVVAIFAYTQFGGSGSEANQASRQEAPSDWQVGELRPNGLRIKPSGRSDSSAVLDPRQFVRSDVKRAYAIPGKIQAAVDREWGPEDAG